MFNKKIKENTENTENTMTEVISITEEDIKQGIAIILGNTYNISDVHEISEKIFNIVKNEEIIKELQVAHSLDKDVEICSLTFKTDHKSNFRNLDGNRKLDNPNLNKLRESIEKYGFRKTSPLTVNKNGEIEAGQHRAHVLKEKNLPFIFNVDVQDVDSLDVVKGLSRAQKTWKLMDYVDSYTTCKNPNQNYVNFKFLVTTLEVSPSLVLWLLYHSRNGRIQEKVRDGNLKCTYEDVAKVQKAIERIVELRNSIPNHLVKDVEIRRSFLTDKIAMPLVVIMSQPQYNHARMLSQIKLFYGSINKNTMQGAGESLVQIYNYKLKKNSPKKLLRYEDMTSNAEDYYTIKNIQSVINNTQTS